MPCTSQLQNPPTHATFTLCATRHRAARCAGHTAAMSRRFGFRGGAVLLTLASTGGIMMPLSRQGGECVHSRILLDQHPQASLQHTNVALCTTSNKVFSPLACWTAARGRFGGPAAKLRMASDVSAGARACARTQTHMRARGHTPTPAHAHTTPSRTKGVPHSYTGEPSGVGLLQGGHGGPLGVSSVCSQR